MAASYISPAGPRWYFIPIRVVLITFVATLLSFAVSLLLGICTVLLIAKIHGASPDLRMAYRLIALPAASTVAVIALISVTVMELRRFRRARTLSHIERQLGRAS
jgi:O-antigen ligase